MINTNITLYTKYYCLHSATFVPFVGLANIPVVFNVNAIFLSCIIVASQPSDAVCMIQSDQIKGSVKSIF